MREPAGAPVGRPMTFGAALGWTLLATVLFVWLLGVTYSVRPAAQGDLVNGMVCQAAAYLAVLFVILRVHAPSASIRAVLGLRAASPLFYVLALVTGAALWVPASGLAHLIEQRFPVPADEALLRVFAEASPAMRVVYGVLLIGLGPLLEEVFFRGALFTPLRQRHRGPAVVLATSVLFALAHVQWQRLLPIALIGVALGLVRWSSRSIGPAVVLHGAFNAVTFVQLVTGPNGAARDVELRTDVVLLGCAVSAALLFALARLGTRADAPLSEGGRS